jgi:hypothetical protein
VIGVVAAVIYRIVALPGAVAPGHLAEWSRRHPLAEGSLLGPLVFLALAYITPWPIRVCLVVGVVASVFGAIGSARGEGVACREHSRTSSAELRPCGTDR